MEELTPMNNTDVCKMLHLTTTAELGFAIHSGQLDEIGVAVPPESTGNKHWIVRVYKEHFEAWDLRRRTR